MKYKLWTHLVVAGTSSQVFEKRAVKQSLERGSVQDNLINPSPKSAQSQTVLGLRMAQVPMRMRFCQK